jgi:hypothetical protein
MQLQERLQELLDDPDAASPRNSDELRGLLARYPMEFRTWAVAWICNGGRGPRAHLLLRLLHQKNLLRSLLVNPGAIPLRDAVRVARLAQHSIANLDWIVADTIREGTVTQAARALQVLQHVPLTGRVVPGLAAALRNPNAKIRSLVSKLLGRLVDNPAAVRSLLQDSDARVRANAVEGFWGSSHPMARDVMRRGLLDSNNRVAANAALGLCKIGDPDGVEALRVMSTHPDHRHRISAAWSIAQLADPALLPALDALAEDRISKVREVARGALARARNPTGLRGEPSLLVSVSRACRTPQGSLRLNAFVTDDDDNPMENLPPDSFRVFRDEVMLPVHTLQPPALRGPLITILWLVEEDLTEQARTKAHDAIVGAMQHCRPEDLYCVVGAALRSPLAFSADPGQLDDALKQAGSSTNAVPDGRERLFRALLLAASRSGCRAGVAFSSGSPPQGSIDVDRFVQQAVKGDITVHVVVFGVGPEISPEWQRIATATQGSYRVVGDEEDLQHAFWWVFSQLSNSYLIAAHGASEGDAEYRLEVRTAGGHGGVRFEPALREAGDTASAGGRHVK